jgi:hypothetical protein
MFARFCSGINSIAIEMDEFWIRADHSTKSVIFEFDYFPFTLGIINNNKKQK